jgi:hypothetical protein
MLSNHTLGVLQQGGNARHNHSLGCHLAEYLEKFGQEEEEANIQSIVIAAVLDRCFRIRLIVREHHCNEQCAKRLIRLYNTKQKQNVPSQSRCFG